MEQILEEAKAQAEAILNEARETAKQTEHTAELTCRSMEAAAGEKAAEMKKLYENRVASRIRQEKRKMLLETKQAMILEVLDEAYEVLKTQPEEAYFSMLEAWIRAYVRPEEGEIYFSKTDISRMSDAFKTRILQAAHEKQGNLRIMPASRDVEDGFVLVYGGIEENCTLRAMMNENKERLVDAVCGILFDEASKG